MMTVRELMERLEDMDPDAEVRLQTQQNYPHQHAVLGVCDSAELHDDEDECEEEEEGDAGEGPRSVVYIVEGSWLGYGLKSAWDCAS
jgi:hypothetical protein